MQLSTLTNLSDRRSSTGLTDTLRSEHSFALQTSSHIHVVLGSKHPKAARDDYDRFLTMTGSCLGGDIPSAELAAAAEALWNAISSVSKAKQERLSAAALLQPYRYKTESMPSADGIWPPELQE